MSDPYVEDFFAVNRWILRFAGLWKPDSKNKAIQVPFTVYAVGIIFFVNIFFVITEFISLTYTYKNEYDLIKNLSVLLTHLLGDGKVIFFYLQGDNVKKILATLESTDLHYENNYNRNFFPAFTSKNYKKVGMKYSLLFLTLGHFVCISAFIAPIKALQSEKYNPEKIIPKKLPYHSWMPFEYDTTATFLIALLYQAISILSFVYSIMGMDTLFMNIMNCIGMNLEIIQGAFASLRERAIEKSMGPSLTPDGLHNSQELKIIVNQEMKKVCRHLQTIYKVCEDLENIYMFLNLAQTLATLLIFCSCLYLVSTADKITSYIWECDWITADTGFKKALVFTMARTNRPLYLTAGKFAPLTLETFVGIIKASYSFYAVIKNTSD